MESEKCKASRRKREEKYTHIRVLKEDAERLERYRGRLETWARMFPCLAVAFLMGERVSMSEALRYLIYKDDCHTARVKKSKATDLQPYEPVV